LIVAGQSGDADIARASQLQHAVECMNPLFSLPLSDVRPYVNAARRRSPASIAQSPPRPRRACCSRRLSASPGAPSRRCAAGDNRTALAKPDHSAPPCSAAAQTGATRDLRLRGKLWWITSRPISLVSRPAYGSSLGSDRPRSLQPVHFYDDQHVISLQPIQQPHETRALLDRGRV
jgi:hypothetical protein